MEFCNRFSALNFIVQSFQTTADGFSDTFTDKDDTDSDIQVNESSETSSAIIDTDIDKSSTSSSADKTLNDASDDDDERGKGTLTSTTKPIQMLNRESSIRKALEFGKDQGSNTGLLKFFNQGTKEGMDTYWKKEEERAAVNEEKKGFKKKIGRYGEEVA